MWPAGHHPGLVPQAKFDGSKARRGPSIDPVLMIRMLIVGYVSVSIDHLSRASLILQYELTLEFVLVTVVLGIVAVLYASVGAGGRLQRGKSNWHPVLSETDPSSRTAAARM